MNVTPIEAAPQYHPSGHFDMRCLRLQGMEAGPSETLWMGMSEIAPGGHTSLSASPYEKLYLVVEGEVVISTEDEEAVLGKLDSCRIAPGEARLLENRGKLPARIVLCMPLAKEKT